MELWMGIVVSMVLALAGMVVVIATGKIAVEGDLWRGTTGEVAISNNATTEANGLCIVCPRW